MKRYTNCKKLFDNKIDNLLYSFSKDPDRLKHMELLADAFFDNLERDECEYGGWRLDSKRPFGNSFVAPDIAEIIGLDRDVVYGENGDEDEDQIRYLDGLYDDLGLFLRYKWLSFRSKEAIEELVAVSEELNLYKGD